MMCVRKIILQFNFLSFLLGYVHTAVVCTGCRIALLCFDDDVTAQECCRQFESCYLIINGIDRSHFLFVLVLGQIMTFSVWKTSNEQLMRF